MRETIFKVVTVAGAGLALCLTGCFSTTRTVLKTQAPTVFRTATIEELEQQLSDRDVAIKTLNAGVLITASTGGEKEGKVTEYTSLRGYIFVRKPFDLRVLLQKPLIGSRAVDMVSDEKTFTLLINGLSGSRAIVGSNKVTKTSKNGLENLRPAVFFDSLLVPGVHDDELVTLTESTRVVTPERKHHDAIEEPDYDLTVLRRVSGHVLKRERVVHINRVDMLPFQQDIYDDEGQIVTTALYDKYQKYGGQQFPSMITIQRPLDEYSLKVEVTKLTINGTFESDQFELKLPAGIAVQKMD